MPEIVDREEWRQARRALLAEEKAFTRARDALAAKRRQMPWVRVDTDYRFATDQGEQSLADLFGPHSQLVVYHFMFDPTWENGCKSCSLVTESLQNIDEHLAARDVSFVIVSRAALDTLQGFAKRLGWTHRWVSSGDGAFNYDFEVSWTPEQLETGEVSYNFGTCKRFGADGPGMSVFTKTDEGIFHTYGLFSRGLEDLMTTYRVLDLVPKGRDESELNYGMEWVKHRDRY